MPYSQALLLMRHSFFVSLLLLMFLLHKTEGIRLDESFKLADNQKLHKEGSCLMERNGNNGVARDVIFCKEGHCTGITRKLSALTTATSATASLKNAQNGGTEAKPSSRGDEKLTTTTSPTPNEHHQEMIHDQYMDNQNIAEMDYSPARRKPPTHN